ncbi:MAG: DUF1592 domain-containing protein [Planctomycetaceae bacterium]
MKQSAIFILITVVCVSQTISFSASCRANPPAATAELFDADRYISTVRPFVQTHCIACHSAETSKGEINMDQLPADFLSQPDLEHWEQILDMLETGEMPPADQPQPEAAAVQPVVTWIRAGLRDAVRRSATVPAAATTRRLTNVEYRNTLRDLLGFELDVIDDLPRDPAKPYEFNNTAELMRIGPEQIDRYLEVARRAMASAIVDPGDPEVHTTRREWLKHGLDRGLALDEIGVYGNRRHSVSNGMGLQSYPQTGEFRIRLQASAILPPGYDTVPLRLIMGNDIQINSSTREVREVGVVDLTNSPDNPVILEFTGRIENFPALPGRTVNGKRQPDRMTLTPQNIYDDGSLNDRFSYGTLRNIDLPRIVINWIEFESPLTDIWPPQHHTNILFESSLRQEDPQAWIREVLQRFMTRAYRRPVTATEVDLFVQVYDLVRPELPTVEAALRETLSMVLISPQFLYHTEAAAAADQHYAMASRLSYFLWASMPDSELLELAEKQQLLDPQVIEQQVLRLLADKRAADFTENFTTQWLSLTKMKTVPINRDLFPRFLYYVPAGERAGTEMPYLPTIRDYMLQETTGFVGELIRRNASAISVVDSDFAMLNQRLAAHYGVPGVTGVNLRPVQVSLNQQLGGLLTHGSVLLGNGTGTAPHPIYRAVWLREAILGDEVPEPPAEVPALSDTAGESAEKAATIAELLVQHRNFESCNDCHFRLDPWGIAFEHYNAIGQYQPKVPREGTRVTVFQKEQHTDMAGYREYLASICTVDVTAASRLPHGPEVAGLRELKTWLLQNRSEQIVRNVTGRLLSYAVGRKLDYRDRFAVERLVKQTSASNHGLRDLIVAICQSPTFRGAPLEKEDEP